MDYKKLIEDLRHCGSNDDCETCPTVAGREICQQALHLCSITAIEKLISSVEAKAALIDFWQEECAKRENERDRLQAEVDKLSRPSIIELRRLVIQLRGERDEARAELEAAEEDIRSIIKICTALGYSPCGMCAHMEGCSKSRSDKCYGDTYSEFERRRREKK